MQNKRNRVSRNRILGSVSMTIVFNTLIAAVLKYLVREQTPFIDIFIISQIMGLSICLSVAVSKRFTDEKRIATVLAGYLVGLLAGVLLGSVLTWMFLYLIKGKNFSVFIKEVFMYTLAFGIIFGVQISYFFSSRERIRASERKVQAEKIKRLTIEKESAVTSLKLLQAQIEPHFLFNTLSNVITLVDIDVEKAKKMLIDINAYLRISLQRTRQEMVTLEEEFAFITRYLDIFKIRMGKRLRYDINAEPHIREISFPPMILQPIVENAIKYGLDPKPEGGRITLDCSSGHALLKIVVTDTGVGFGQSDGRAGIGLNNVSTRLENIYGSQARLILTENRPTGVKVMIEVPI